MGYTPPGLSYPVNPQLAQVPPNLSADTGTTCVCQLQYKRSFSSHSHKHGKAGSQTPSHPHPHNHTPTPISHSTIHFPSLSPAIMWASGPRPPLKLPALARPSRPMPRPPRPPPPLADQSLSMRSMARSRLGLTGTRATTHTHTHSRARAGRQASQRRFGQRPSERLRQTLLPALRLLTSPQIYSPAARASVSQPP